VILVLLAIPDDMTGISEIVWGVSSDRRQETGDKATSIIDRQRNPMWLAVKIVPGRIFKGAFLLSKPLIK